MTDQLAHLLDSPRNDSIFTLTYPIKIRLSGKLLKSIRTGLIPPLLPLFDNSDQLLSI
jgi:hypothetical protein